MLIKTIEGISQTNQFFEAPNWSSARLLVSDDNMGFSVHVTRIFSGPTGDTEYPHHLEAAYCVEGHATLFYDADKRQAEIRPGSIYALNNHDKHRMIVHEELVLICVFNPALSGSENASKKQ